MKHLHAYRKIICLYIIILTQLLLSACSKPGEKIEDPIYAITTKPLYVNNEVYVSNTPIVEINGKVCIPVNICLNDLSQINTEEEGVYRVNENIYASTEYVKDILGWNIYEGEEAIFIDDFKKRFDYSWTKNSYVAHAFGAIGSDTYTNCLEAFYKNYENGHRLFEVDFSLTSDDKLVAIHDWSENTTVNVCGFDLNADQIGTPLSKSEFLNLKVKGKYTTLSFEDIIEIMIAYPDIYIITDTKETQDPYISQQFQYMFDAAAASDPSVLDRIIPQIYNENMFEIIMGIYDWKSVIYTLYNQGHEFSPERVIDFSYKNDIRVVTTYTARAHDLFLHELFKRGRTVYMHTYNTEEDIALWKTRGISGFYTDFLCPEK